MDYRRTSRISIAFIATETETETERRAPPVRRCPPPPPPPPAAAAGEPPPPPPEMAMVVAKRPAETALVASDAKRGALATRDAKPDRFSRLMAPTMKVEGHKGAINSMKFAPNGVFFATGSYDKQIYLWEVYGECPHVTTLQGHKNAVLEVQYSADSEKIFSASADKTVAVWDTQTGYRIKKVRLPLHVCRYHDASIGSLHNCADRNRLT